MGPPPTSSTPRDYEIRTERKSSRPQVRIRMHRPSASGTSNA